MSLLHFKVIVFVLVGFTSQSHAKPSVRRVFGSSCKKAFVHVNIALDSAKARAKELPRRFRNLSVDSLELSQSLDTELASLEVDVSPPKFMSRFHEVFMQHLFKHHLSKSEAAHIKLTIHPQNEAEFNKSILGRSLDSSLATHTLFQTFRRPPQLHHLLLKKRSYGKSELEVADIFRTSVILRNVTRFYKKLLMEGTFYPAELHEIAHILDSIMRFRSQGIPGALSYTVSDFENIEYRERFAISLEWEYTSRIPSSVRAYFLKSIETQLRDLDSWQEQLKSPRSITLASLLSRQIYFTSDGKMRESYETNLRRRKSATHHSRLVYLYGVYRLYLDAHLSKQQYVRRALSLRYPVDAIKQSASLK